jgi:lysophospholipase L1-like esterase
VRLMFRSKWMWASVTGVAVVALLVTGMALRSGSPTPLVMPAAAVALVDSVRVAVVPDALQGTPLSWVAVGRVQSAPPHGAWHEWPGIALAVRFEGDAVHIALDDPENRFRVLVDGVAVAEITRLGAATVALQGLGPGAHDLRLERLSEAWTPRRIVSISVPPPGRPLPAPALPRHRIDVYGDSDTVGFGLARGDRRCAADDIFLSTDTTLAYPALLARRYGASAAVMARSGIGLIRGLDRSPPEQNLLELHGRTLPSSPVPANAENPWLIMVEVGGNDFGQPLHAGEVWADEDALSAAFTAAFGGFLRGLARDAPGTPVAVLTVPDPGKGVPPEIMAVAERLIAEGAPVRLVLVNGLDYRGCGWHPSRADHERIADVLAKTIDGLITDGLLENK